MHYIDEYDWARVKKLGLLSNIKTPNDYLEATTLGSRISTDAFKNYKSVIPPSNLIQSLHKSMFEEVHPWAGQIRKEGQEVAAGQINCTLAKDIPKELNILNKEMISNSLEGSNDYKAQLIAYYHASFEEIHPFLDGNGRIGRIIMDGQTQKLMGKKLAYENFTRLEYIESLHIAQSQGNLDPFAHLIVTNSVSIKNPTIEQLRIREKDLLKERKKLGFIGTELDAIYGLGGFEPPITEGQAIKFAKSYPDTTRSVNSKTFDVLKDNQSLLLKQQSVQKELIKVREHLQKLNKRLDNSENLTKRLTRSL